MPLGLGEWAVSVTAHLSDGAKLLVTEEERERWGTERERERRREMERVDAEVEGRATGQHLPLQETLGKSRGLGLQPSPQVHCYHLQNPTLSWLSLSWPQMTLM